MRLLYLNVSGSLSWRLPYCTDLKRQTLSSSKHFVMLQNNFIIVLLIQTYWLCVPFHLCNLEKQYNVDKKISPKMHFLNKLSNRIPYLVKLSEQSVELSVKVLKLKSYKIIIITVVFLLDFSVVLLIWTDSCLSKLDPSQIAWSLPLVSECDTILTLNIDFNTSVSCVTTTLVVNYINNQPCYLHTNVMGLTTSTFWPSPLKLAALVYDAHFRSVTPPPSVFVCECVFACVRVCARECCMWPLHLSLLALYFWVSHWTWLCLAWQQCLYICMHSVYMCYSRLHYRWTKAIWALTHRLRQQSRDLVEPFWWNMDETNIGTRFQL